MCVCVCVCALSVWCSVCGLYGVQCLCGMYLWCTECICSEYVWIVICIINHGYNILRKKFPFLPLAFLEEKIFTISIVYKTYEILETKFT